MIGYDFNFEGILSFILGTRSYWLYAPLTLIIIHLFKQDDLIKFFEINLFFVFPYFLLTLIQHFLSDTSIINSGFNSIVLQPDRPSGYFIYTTQNTFYFIFYKLYKRYIIDIGILDGGEDQDPFAIDGESNADDA